MKVRELIRLLHSHGWTLIRQKGSHRQFGHSSRPGVVTVSGHEGDEMPKGTLNNVLKQAGLK